MVRGAFYRDGQFLEFRLWFAGAALADGASLSIGAGLWTIQVKRQGDGFTLRIPAAGLSTGLDACSHVSLDDASGELVVRVPAVLLSSSTPTEVTVGTSSKSGAASDSAKGSILLAYPGPESNVLPACQLPSTARTSTVAFREISLGDGFGCGATLAGEAICWGEGAALTTLGAAPAGDFVQVSVSVHSWWQPEVYACGLRSDKQIICWGGSPPTVTGTYRSMGDPFGCAITDAGDLACIDMGTGGNEIRSAPGPIAEVVGAGTEECHRTEGGSISCLTAGMAPAGNDFIGLAFGSTSRACGLHASGSLDCEAASAIPYPLQSIDAGGRPDASFAIGCGLTHTGAPICWGAAGLVPSVNPGPFTRLEVSSTGEGICGFRADSTLVCWDYSYVAGNPVPATTPP